LGVIGTHSTAMRPRACAPSQNLWLACSPFGQVDMVGVDGHTPPASGEFKILPLPKE